jgi:hypothetical protein
MCPDAPLNRTASKSQRQRFSARLRRGFQARGIARLDFIPQWRSLAICNCRITRRRGFADVAERFAAR